MQQAVASTLKQHCTTQYAHLVVVTVQINDNSIAETGNLSSHVSVIWKGNSTETMSHQKWMQHNVETTLFLHSTFAGSGVVSVQINDNKIADTGNLSRHVSLTWKENSTETILYQSQCNSPTGCCIDIETTLFLHSMLI